ncbi:hypothetical protein OPT61_g8592 [Boeremia exigua]|uniref:Uncharacterized protein n=1 Tax=Boeremia exigua TaxID=749465 RepID=A0ACC2HY70_9PLEO|nr:hypothetical protein OPT61_g8592 [Boeremia exigua]
MGNSISYPSESSNETQSPQTLEMTVRTLEKQLAESQKQVASLEELKIVAERQEQFDKELIDFLQRLLDTTNDVTCEVLRLPEMDKPLLETLRKQNMELKKTKEEQRLRIPDLQCALSDARKRIVELEQ